MADNIKHSERKAETGHGWGRTQAEEEAQKIQQSDPNEMAERIGISKQQPAKADSEDDAARRE